MNAKLIRPTLPILLFINSVSSTTHAQTDPQSSPTPRQTTIVHGIESDTGTPFSFDPATGRPISLDPSAGWTEMVTAAKTAEEGDADLKTASSQYEAIIRVFLKLRPIAAEALSRYSAIEAKRNNNTESKESRRRLIEWFPDLPQFTQNLPIAATSAPGGGGGTVAPSAQATESAMRPELRQRYGLDASQPPYTLSAGVPGSAAPSTDDFERNQLIQLKSMLLAEASRTGAELRKIRQEMARVDGRPVTEIPPQLVSDPKLRSLLDRVSEPMDPSVVLHTDPATNQKMKVQFHHDLVEALEKYFGDYFLPRLKNSKEALERELNDIKMEASRLDKELERRFVR